MDKSYYREYQKLRKARAKKEGICQNCMKEPAKRDRTCCQTCLDKKKLNVKFGASGRVTELYESLYERQLGKCLICLEQMLRPCLDHSHKTLEVRGLLCNRCNSGLGYFQDNIERLRRAIVHIEENRVGIKFKTEKAMAGRKGGTAIIDGRAFIPRDIHRQQPLI